MHKELKHWQKRRCWCGLDDNFQSRWWSTIFECMDNITQWHRYYRNNKNNKIIVNKQQYLLQFRKLSFYNYLSSTFLWQTPSRTANHWQSHSTGLTAPPPFPYNTRHVTGEMVLWYPNPTEGHYQDNWRAPLMEITNCSFLSCVFTWHCSSVLHILIVSDLIMRRKYGLTLLNESVRPCHYKNTVFLCHATKKRFFTYGHRFFSCKTTLSKFLISVVPNLANHIISLLQYIVYHYRIFITTIFLTVESSFRFVAEAFKKYGPIVYWR